MSSSSSSSLARRDGLWRHLTRAFPWILLVAALAFCTDRYHLLQSLEFIALDILSLFKADRSAEEIRIVAISEEDYRTLFESTSPLNEGALSALIGDVASACPRVIGVDIETAAPALVARVEQRRRARQSQFGGSCAVPIIWALTALPIQANTSPPIIALTEPAQRIAAAGLLGGVTLIPRDFDGLVRRYLRTLPLSTGNDREHTSDVDALPWAIAKAFCDGRASGGCPRPGEVIDRDDAELLLNFAGDRFRFKRLPASVVNDTIQSANWRDNEIKDRIVLIGGMYSAARDEYWTPVGRMAGVELIAQVIQTELEGGGLVQVDHSTLFALDVLVGLALATLNWWLPPRMIVHAAVNAFVVLVLPATAMILAYTYQQFWLNLLPTGAGVWLHQFIDRVHERRHDYAELLTLRAREARLAQLIGSDTYDALLRGKMDLSGSRPPVAPLVAADEPLPEPESQVLSPAATQGSKVGGNDE